MRLAQYLLASLVAFSAVTIGSLTYAYTPTANDHARIDTATSRIVTLIDTRTDLTLNTVTILIQHLSNTTSSDKAKTIL